MATGPTTGSQKDTSFIPNLGDTGTISSLHWGTMNNELLLAGAGFNVGMDLFKVAPGGQTPNRLQGYQSQRIAQKATAAPCVSVQVDSANRLVFGGCCDGTIQAWSPEHQNQMMQIGTHSNIVCNIRHSTQYNVLLSAGYDGQLKYWDVRSQQCQGTLQAPNKIVSMDYRDNLVVCALADKNILLIDIRKPTTIMSTYQSQLDETNQGVLAMPNNSGYIISSIDGRARVEYLQPTQQESFPFRAHRVEVQNQVPIVHAFSPAAHHPQYNTLLTCGTDGTWITWDYISKNRLTTSDRYPNPISSAAFSPDGSCLAFASSYNYYKGANGDPTKTQQNNQNYLPRIGLYPISLINLQFKGK